MKISVIIPTYNESGCLAQTLAAAKTLPGDFEIIVADGGSHDGTIQIASKMGVDVVRAPIGRAVQMNRGAELARGEVLLFLHADTFLPQNAHSLIAEALIRPGAVGGCFRLGFDQGNYLLRSIAFFTRFSFRLFHYGDQAFFIRSSAFEKLQGYRLYPIMEDLDLWLRMCREGKVVVISRPVITSSRRFLRNGIVRQQLVNIVLVILFLFGVKPQRLKWFYEEIR